MGLGLIRIWSRGIGFFSLSQAFVMLWLAQPAAAGPTGAEGAAAPIALVVLGDSLAAGYGLPPDASFPAQLETALKARGFNVRVANAGVSGDMTADGLARLDWSVPEDADGVIVELGANDALRGVPVERTRKNLSAILTRLRQRRLPALLAGMRAPGNWGPEYSRNFAALFPALAQEHGAILYSFFLDGVAFQPELNQADGLHPTREGVAVIVERIKPSVEKLIKEIKAARTNKIH
jgi:acyl-CoA thioesterase-1